MSQPLGIFLTVVPVIGRIIRCVYCVSAVLMPRPVLPCRLQANPAMAGGVDGFDFVVAADAVVQPAC